MKVYLVGPAGVGKTTVGRIVARQLGLAFLDADEFVAARAGMPLGKIFSREGEQGFRRREKDAVRLITQMGSLVAALGGGAVLDPEIGAWLTSSGAVVALVAETGVLVDRLRRSPRPGLPHPADPAFAERAGQAIAARVQAAGALGPVVDASRLAPAEVAARVLAVLGAAPGPPDGAAGPPDGAGGQPGGAAGWHGQGAAGGDGWEMSLRLGGADCLVRAVPGAVLRGELAFPSSRASSLLVVSSPRPYCLYGSRLVEGWRGEGRAVHVTLVPDGEDAKRPRWLNHLWREWAGRRADRGACVLALGGGATSDLAGLAAATYLRGVPWVVVPTTLLAQVDAALGGKVAIDLPEGKNLAGSFWHPVIVYVDVEVLRSLPREQLVSGLAEVVKCALLEGEEFLELIEQEAGRLLSCDGRVLGQVVWRCLELKAAVVAGDEREGGPRQLLNLGHTVGHALEREAGWDHGRAVAVGLVAACELAGAAELAARVRALLAKLGLPAHLPGGMARRVWHRMRWDKKARQGELRFVLPHGPGRVDWGVPVEPGRVREVLRRMEG